jgi:hypothetical protein
MSVVSSWIRKRFDSQESENGNCETASNDNSQSPEPGGGGGRGGGGGESSRGVKTTSLSFESETDSAKASGGSKGVAKVMTQWQKAVRKLSVNSSGYNSGSGDPSPSPSTSASRTSMEKPSWALRQQYQPRSRHLSINVDSGQGYVSHPRSCATPIPECRPVENRTRIQPSSLPPYAGHLTLSPPRPNHCLDLEPPTTDNDSKSRTPSGSSTSNTDPDSSKEESSSPGDQMTDEFPYGPALKAALGRVTAFPDGTEAVMIDSAIALEVFQIDQMVIKNKLKYNKSRACGLPLKV